MEDCCDDCDPAGAAVRKPAACCGLSVFLVSIILFAMSWGTLEPTEYGLVTNGITGRVDLDPNNVHEGGRYFIWLRHYFLVFPKNRVNLEFSDSPSSTYFSQPTIPARTGPDPDDRESGGQPVDLAVSFQYRFRKDLVPSVYQTFGQAWEPSYMRFAQQAITNVAQQYTPRQFWDERSAVEDAMHRAVNTSIFTQGFAEVPQLQLMQVGFNDNYEATITNIQLQEQLKVTKNYQLEVTRVLKEVDILQSQTEAAIALIDAEAAREAAVIRSRANANALTLEQATKAHWYAQLKQHMGWNNTHVLQYVKMKSLNAQPASSMVVGVSPVGS
jgi:hypothetical protein